jgi:predicted metal-dependent HD superfamily phosphohydrolase
MRAIGYEMSRVRQAFEERGVNGSFLEAYFDPTRFYHGWGHIQEVLGLMSVTLSEDSNFPALCAAAFHDAVYDVSREDNEERSADLFMGTVTSGLTEAQRLEVRDAILCTRDHIASGGPLSERLCAADMYPLLEGGLGRLFDDERSIFKEYQRYPVEAYAAERSQFLREVAGRKHTTIDAALRIRSLADHVERRAYRVAALVHGFSHEESARATVRELEQSFDKVALCQPRAWAEPGKLTVNWLPEWGLYQRVSWMEPVDLARAFNPASTTFVFAVDDHNLSSVLELVDQMRGDHPEFAYMTAPTRLRWRKFTPSQLKYIESGRG